MKNFFIFSLSFLFLSSSLKANLTQEQQKMEVKILLDFVNINTEKQKFFIKKKNGYIQYITDELKRLGIVSEPKQYSDVFTINDFYVDSEIHITIYKGVDNNELAMEEVKKFMQFLFRFTQKNTLALDRFGAKDYYNGQYIGRFQGIRLDPYHSYHISIFDENNINEIKNLLLKEKKKQTLDDLLKDLEKEREEVKEKIVNNDFKEKFANALKSDFFKKFYLFFITKMQDVLEKIIDDSKFLSTSLEESPITMTESEKTKQSELLDFFGKKSKQRRFFENILAINNNIINNDSLPLDKKNRKLIEQYINVLIDFTEVFFDIFPENILDQNQEDKFYDFCQLIKKVRENAQQLPESARVKWHVLEKKRIEQQNREAKEKQAEEEGGKLLEEASKKIQFNKFAKAFKPRYPKP